MLSLLNEFRGPGACGGSRSTIPSPTNRQARPPALEFGGAIGQEGGAAPRGDRNPIWGA